MADVTEKSGPLALLVGLVLFVVFETVAYYLLEWATSPLGMPDQMQPENTIVPNWVKTVVFLLLHLVLVVVAVLTLSNQLPRRYRGQVMGWFYLSLLMGFVLLIPLFG
ncbi:hypothetical protein MTX78_22415 [Hymenobacter tibetensis]|jgi:hypothetical protein|uniref:Cardiolipin synthase N-terminal domain-containing protein n=1 Tax=Hymenobacter tibetensis TaxID=497967 RepID=A0ABY4CX56_9BACT|nr:hypothetical protein [Hymenobacter tibetensis]UOG74855.1 hypothetical protein MTX78_22415 [Hymenobacter tibetensis]